MLFVKIALTWIIILFVAGIARVPLDYHMSIRASNIYGSVLSVAAFVTFIAAMVVISLVIWRCL